MHLIGSRKEPCQVALRCFKWSEPLRVRPELRSRLISIEDTEFPRPFLGRQEESSALYCFACNIEGFRSPARCLWAITPAFRSGEAVRGFHCPYIMNIAQPSGRLGEHPKPTEGSFVTEASGRITWHGRAFLRVAPSWWFERETNRTPAICGGPLKKDTSCLCQWDVFASTKPGFL